MERNVTHAVLSHDQDTGSYRARPPPTPPSPAPVCRPPAPGILGLAVSLRRVNTLPRTKATVGFGASLP